MLPWPLVRASSVFELKYGRALVESSREPGRVPVYGSNGRTGWHDSPLFHGPGVVLGRKGMGNLGVEWVDGDFWVIDTAYSLDAADGADLKFAYYLIGYVGLNHLKDGSSNPSLTRETFGAQLFPFPPLEEQRRIAAILVSLDDLIGVGRAQIARLEALARVFAATARATAELGELARPVHAKQVKPSNMVEHYSLPAFDEGAEPERVAGDRIQSNKLPIAEPCVLISRLNPRWERCWMVYPGTNAVASTEFVPVVGTDAASEEVWAVTSSHDFWDQMRTHVTGTTGSHQRVDKAAVLTLNVPDVRTLASSVRREITTLVKAARELRNEVVDLALTRDELLPLLLSGKVRVSESLEVA